MKVDTSDLVTAIGIARRAGVGQAAVWNWAKRHDDFPKPVFSEDRTNLWRWSQVKKWLEKTGRASADR